MIVEKAMRKRPLWSISPSGVSCKLSPDGFFFRIAVSTPSLGWSYRHAADVHDSLLSPVPSRAIKYVVC